MNSNTETAARVHEAPRPVTGAAAIALAIAFNVPFSILAATYDYPDVLRGPAGEALDKFAAGGASLILTWDAFALTALALLPVAIALSVTRGRIAANPGVAVGAAVAGALAAFAQAFGLFRWVFVVPGLAHVHADPEASEAAKLAAEQSFALINQYGGVAIGEHLGQLLTALFVVLVAAMQWDEGKRISAGIGFVAALTIAIGTGEGLAIALGSSGEPFAMVTIAGFVGLTVWLIATGVGLIRGK